MSAKKSRTLRPLGDRVLVKRCEDESESAGKLIIPDTAKQKQERGNVISVGPGKRDSDGKKLDIPLKAGDLVIWDKYSAQEITLDEEDYIIVKFDDVIAIVE